MMKIKLSKGGWIGLAVAALWIVGFVVGMKYCNWYFGCNGAVKSTLFCSFGGSVFFFPGIFIIYGFQDLLPYFPGAHFLSVIWGVFAVLLSGILFGTAIEKLPQAIRNLLFRILIIFFVILGGYLAVLWVSHDFNPRFIEIDRCFDSGGKWIYEKGREGCQSMD